MRRPSLSQHPLFAAKARGLRTRILRFTPSWFSVTMVSQRVKQYREWRQGVSAAKISGHDVWAGDGTEQAVEE